VTRPERQLIGFARVNLPAGAAARMTFTARRPRREQLPLPATVTLTGEPREVGHDRVLATPILIEPID